MKTNFFKILPFFFLLFPSLQEIKAQDSLYLIGTITGESHEKRITDVKGIGDINGDGYDDFMISERTGKLVRDEGVVKLYLGSAAFDLVPDLIFHYPGADNLNDFRTASGIGDINNDGYDDFAIMGIFGDWGGTKGKVFIYYGGETIDTIPVAEFNEPWVQDYFGKVVVNIGDINKDEYKDFIITSSYNWSDAKGRAYLFYGGDTISWNRSITFESNTLGDFYGTSAANIGDINKDGFDDIAISATEWTSLVDTAKVFVYYGGNSMDTSSDTILVSGNAADEFGRVIKNAGDLNKDGVVDYCIATSDSIFVYTGKNKNTLKIKGYSIDSKGDINNDGYDDLIVGTDWKIKIYFGSENFDTNTYLNINDEDSLGFTANIFIAKDINYDGFDDMLTISPYWPNPDVPVGKVLILSYRKIVDVKNEKRSYQNNFQLNQNFPNPFNPTTKIQYRISNRQYINIKVYDILGREIITLMDGEIMPGEYQVEFNAAKYNLSSGVYLYELKTKDGTLHKKMILLR